MTKYYIFCSISTDYLLYLSDYLSPFVLCPACNDQFSLLLPSKKTLCCFLCLVYFAHSHSVTVLASCVQFNSWMFTVLVTAMYPPRSNVIGIVCFLSLHSVYSLDLS